MSIYEAEFASAISRIIRGVNDAANKAESERAKADPATHKLSRVMEGKHAMNYRWAYAGRDGRGRNVWFCWTVHRNVAGYFLGWRQVSRKDHVTTRDQWIARKAKWRARAVAERRVESFRLKHLPKMDDRTVDRG